MFKTVFHKRFCKIALLILVDALTECRTRVSEYLPSYISVTGMVFSSGYQECRCLSKTHKNLWETFHIHNWAFRSGCSIQWQSYRFFWKNKPVALSLNTQDASILTLKTSVMVKRLKGTQKIYLKTILSKYSKNVHFYTFTALLSESVLILDITNYLMEL